MGSMHVFRRPRGRQMAANNINAMTEDGRMHVKENITQARAKKTGNDSMMKLADKGACRASSCQRQIALSAGSKVTLMQ
jgi:hypothetical protein